MHPRVAVLTIVTGLVAWLMPVAAQEPPGTLTIARLAPAHPGDVVLIAVEGPESIAALEGRALNQTVRFWRGADAGRWEGLVPVDLETRPGAYDLTVRSVDETGMPIAASRATLRVRSKVFETRRLRVASRFADPPKSEVARIIREAELLTNLFASISPERLWHGTFEFPVPGTATSSFGRLTLLNGRPNGRHRGADFRATLGTPVRAPNSGRVVLAADLYFSGNTVVLDHGLGLFSLFAHLSTIVVAPGELVARGALLGEAGATGRVTGPHLHWAVRMGEVSLDPLSLMTAAAAIGGPEASLASQ